MANPELIFITYNDDPLQADVNAYGAWISDGGYLPLVAGEYGVGNGTFYAVGLDPTMYPAPTGTTGNAQAFPTYLETLFSAGLLPAYAPNNLYTLVLPSTWADVATFCMSQGGYHTYFSDGSGNQVLYAITPNCQGTATADSQIQQLEVTISHEVIEGTTDPLLMNWVIQDSQNPWMYLGGEVGDLCSGATSYYTVNNAGSDGGFSFSSQLIWSNQAVDAGAVPCQPWNPSDNYYALVGPATMATGAPGSTVPITVTGWSSDGSSGPMDLTTAEGDFSVDFPTMAQLSATTVATGDSVTVTLTIPSTATPGQHGATWVLAADPNTGLYQGSTMVGVTVQ